MVPQTIRKDIANPNWLRFEFLEFCVGKTGWTAGAELGLWEGRTICHLLTRFPKLTMIGVDLWKEQPGNPGPEGYEGWDHGQHERTCRSRCAPFGRRVRIIKDWTDRAAALVEDASLDFVFIDADHSEAGCRRDIEAWLPKLKPSGWIMGHDVNWEGVRAAVEDLVPGYEIGPDVVWFRPLDPGPDWPVWK
jgi:hypothetical protein